MSLQVLAAAADHEFETPGPEIFWQPLFGEGWLAITRPAIVFVISIALLAWLFLAGTRRLAVVPGKRQWAVEGVYGMVRNGVGRDIIGSRDFRKFVPLLFTLFSVILLNNLFGVIPPVQYPTFSRIAFPIALVAVVYVTYHVIGIQRKGLGGYLKGLVPAGLPGGIVWYVWFLEALTAFVVQPITLALRLFGNMFAGHIILVLFISGAEYMLFDGGIGLKVVSIPTFILAFVMTLFEILVEFLQAYVFTLLTANYIAAALASEH